MDLTILKKIVPVIAGSLAGPFGGIVTELLSSWLGVSKDALPDALLDPNNAAKLQELEQQYKSQLMQLSSQDYSTEVEDRKSARDREVEITKLIGKRDWVMDWIAIVVISGFFVMCSLMAIMKLDNADHDILYMLMGQLTSGFILVLGYYFGSSKRTLNT